MIQAESDAARKTAAGAMSLRLANSAERRMRLEPLAQVAFVVGGAGGRCAFGFDDAGIDRVDANLPRSQFLSQRPGQGIDGGLGRAVDGSSRRSRGCDHRAEVDDAAARRGRTA